MSASDLVATPLDGDAWLTVAVRAGVVELAGAAVLRGTARRLVETLGTADGEETVARWLRAEGAASEEDARADARRFAAELRGLSSPATAEGWAFRAGATEDTAQPAVPPDAWSRLARAVLASGRRLRFRARGRSMRPFLPHGTRVEIAARDFEAVRLGEIVLHRSGAAPLVAHRVVGREPDALFLRGDSNARLDRITRADYLGVVAARELRGRWRSLTGRTSRALGLAAGLGYGASVGLLRALFLRPMRGTFRGPSLVRGSLRGVLRGVSAFLLGLERLSVRLRRPIDVLRAALLSSEEKDQERARLYQRKAIQEFTSLEENVRSGLTLLEEVLLARHPVPPGRTAPGRVLVLGCGPGRECLVLARRGFAVTGIDREEGMLARARELARESGLAIQYRRAEAMDFELEGQPYDAVILFSGLYNMLLPRARRVDLLRAACRHLWPGGSVLVTFLSAYVRPGTEAEPAGKHLLEALNPEHERGDLYLLNEAIHVFPRGEDLIEEAREAGLETVDLFRDQRAYDRAAGQVRGYAVLRRPASFAPGPVNPGAAGDRKS